jgi:hypothetical protein
MELRNGENFRPDTTTKGRGLSAPSLQRVVDAS